MRDDVHGYLLRAKCGPVGAFAIYPLVQAELLNSLAEAERLAQAVCHKDAAVAHEPSQKVHQDNRADEPVQDYHHVGKAEIAERLEVGRGALV